jgi:hypothetical protein
MAVIELITELKEGRLQRAKEKESTPLKLAINIFFQSAKNRDKEWILRELEILANESQAILYNNIPTSDLRDLWLESRIKN